VSDTGSACIQHSSVNSSSDSGQSELELIFEDFQQQSDMCDEHILDHLSSCVVDEEDAPGELSMFLDTCTAASGIGNHSSRLPSQPRITSPAAAHIQAGPGLAYPDEAACEDDNEGDLMSFVTELASEDSCCLL
jgi:hypothetical protein